MNDENPTTALLRERGKTPEKFEHLCRMEVMGREGDTKYMWDPNIADEVEAAKKQFDYFTKEKKYAAFQVDDNGNKTGNQVREFNPKAGRIIFVPPIAGG